MKLFVELVSYAPPQHKLHLTYKIKTIIRELQQHFIFTAVDKSNNDFAIICKKHYLQNIRNEHNTRTYEEITHTTIPALLTTHKTYLNNSFIKVDDTEPYIPYLHHTQST